MNLGPEELATFNESENEEEVEFKSEESEYETEEDIREEVDNGEECSEDEVNDMEEITRMHDGKCFIFVSLKCVESEFLCEFNMVRQRKVKRECLE